MSTFGSHVGYYRTNIIYDDAARNSIRQRCTVQCSRVKKKLEPLAIYISPNPAALTPTEPTKTSTVNGQLKFMAINGVRYPMSISPFSHMNKIKHRASTRKEEAY